MTEKILKFSKLWFVSLVFQRRRKESSVEELHVGGGNTQDRQVVDITAIHRVPRPVIHVRAVRRKGCVIESNPSPHGGRGALPSEGGSPSDLLFLAGGGHAALSSLLVLY